MQSIIWKRDEKGLLIDTGVGAGNLKEYIDKNIASKPYDVLLTHGHLDHIGAILQYPKILVNGKGLGDGQKLDLK